MNNFLSLKFKFYSFIAMLLLVFVHGYNLQNSYLQPFTIVNEPLTITTFTEYFLANGLFRFRIPMLFIISGYLFASQDAKPYGIRMKKRLKTLGIPYLVWSGFALLLTFLWQEFPFTAEAVHDAQLDQLGDNRLYSEIGAAGLFLRWILAPVAFQLWFIRNLLIYNAIYPLLLKAVTGIPTIWFAFVLFLWLISFGIPFIEGEGLLFFTLGIFLKKSNFDPTKTPRWLSLNTGTAIFIISASVKTYLAFQLDGNTASFILLSLLHKICVFSGLVTIWFGCDFLVRYCMSKKWFLWLSAFGFMIYVLHAPLVYYCMHAFFMKFPSTSNLRLMLFFLLPLLVSATCILFGAIIRKLFPLFYSFTTGGRGLV